MALSRAEIELLIKARNEAQGAFDQLNKQVKTVTGETDKASAGMDTLGTKTKATGVAAGAAGVAFGLLAERVGRGLVNAFGETIAAANRLDSGLVGLGATAKAFGTDANAAQDAAKKLAGDGLMSVGEAAAGLKNLLAGGFNLPEAIELMNRFKDSAAFGRQGSLEFGQAIVGATEGIKNGNSALVDNAGLTKNLSNILIEAGYSAQDLSKVQSDLNVRQALYNGILKETNPQLGQTALYLETAAGKQTQFNSQIEIAQQRIGKALQPALAATLNTLTPMVQIIGNNAETFVRLASAVAVVVGPLAAMRAAAALGIPSISDLTSGLKGLSTQAGMSVKDLGLLKSAGAVAAAAFVGWQIGRIIGDLTGATAAIERFAGAAGRAAAASQTAGAKQDTINLAIRNGAAATISYTDAIEHNARVGAIRAAQFDKSDAAQRRAIDAELALGRVTTEQANAQRAALDAEANLAKIREGRMKVADILAKSEKQFKDEMAATGITVREATNLLKTNEAGFDAWAKQVQLSDATIKKLKDSLKVTEDQQKKNAEATKKQEEATKQLTEQLEAMAGIITQKSLNEKLKTMETLLNEAAKQGAPALKTAVQSLWPELQKLRDQAVASGLAVGNLDGVMTQAAQGANLLLTNVKPMAQFVPLVEGITEANRVNTTEVRAAVKAQEDLTAAYKHFGIQAPQDLRTTADASRRNYEVLLSSGTATTQQLKAAYRQMVDDQKAATLEVPSFWEKNVFPGVKRTIETLQTAVNGSFAQMLLGAKGFGDGFKDIWNSIKASTMQVLNEMLSAFLNQFLKGMLGAMSGQRGAFSAAFGGLFGGGGMAGGPGGFNLQSLLGIGGGAGEFIGPVMPGGAGGVASGTGGGLLGGVSMAGLGGGLLAGGGGLGLGMLGSRLFGAGAGGAAFGGLSGAAQGALIGSIVPGIGTAIGAAIGGLTGVIGGLFGKSKEERARDEFIGNFGGQGTGEGSGFMNLAHQLTVAGAGAGGGQLFQNLLSADSMKELEAAVKAIESALLAAQNQTAATAAATDELAGAVIDAATAEQDLAEAKADTSEVTLAALEAERAALEANEATILANLDALNKQGDEGPAAMGKVEEAIKAVETQLQANRLETDRVEAEIKELSSTTIDRARSMDRAMEGVENQFRDAARAAFGAAGQIDQAFSGLSFDIPVNFDVGDMPTFNPDGSGGGGGEEIPLAAKGVMADRASLVVFGEGGEAEVGGPRSFFRDVFEQLAKEGVGLGGDGGGPTIVFNISAMSGADVQTTIQTKVMPELVNILRTNRNGNLTNVKQILGLKG